MKDSLAYKHLLEAERRDNVEKPPFRLLDLPVEIRDRIYYEILCTWSEQVPRPDGKDYPDTRLTDLYAMEHGPELAILRTNRQVYEEAKAVMLKGNQFIRISMTGIWPFELFLIPYQIPVVSILPNAISRYRGFVMTYSIDVVADPKECKKRVDVMILRRDLDLFLKAVAEVEIPVPEAKVMNKHKITIHNPFVGTLSPNFLDEKNQERLLEPYRKHFRGFKNFQIGGDVLPGVANTILREVKKDSDPDPQRLVEWLTLHKELGNGHYRKGDNELSATFWNRVTLQIFNLVKTRHWPIVKAAGGKSFEDQFTAVLFQITNNRLAGIIRSMKKQAPHARHENEQEAFDTFHLAGSLNEILGTDWQGDKVQLAKCARRVAVVARLTDGDKEAALDLIDLAAQRDPTNRAIQQERQAIMRWISTGIVE